MLEDMHARLQGEVIVRRLLLVCLSVCVDCADCGGRQLERREREGTEETLLKLLEETCSRVESGLRA
jgi:hypothetical protein